MIHPHQHLLADLVVDHMENRKECFVYGTFFSTLNLLLINLAPPSVIQLVAVIVLSVILIVLCGLAFHFGEKAHAMRNQMDIPEDQKDRLIQLAKERWH